MGFPDLHSLPRLPRIYYQEDAVVHWTMTIQERGTGWLTREIHLPFRELMLHTAAREGLFCPAYCLMPDHIHLVWMGLQPDSDQRNGMAFLRTHFEPWLGQWRFQHQPHDHVLSSQERQRNAFAKTCFYILNNPVRAELADPADQWEYLGAVTPGYPDANPLEDHFWKWYVAARSPEIGERHLPPRSTSHSQS